MGFLATSGLVEGQSGTVNLPSGSDRVLAAFVIYHETTDQNTSPTYGGNAATGEVGDFALEGNECGLELHYWLEADLPGDGDNTFDIGSTLDNPGFGVIILDGRNQAAPDDFGDVSNHLVGDGNTISVTLTAAADDSDAVSAAVARDASTWTHGTGQTEDWDAALGGSAYSACGTHETGIASGSETQEHTTSSGDRKAMKAAIWQPAAGGGTTENITATLAGTSSDSVGSIILNLTGTTTLAGTSLDGGGMSLKESLAATLAGTSLDSGAVSTTTITQLAATLAGTSLDGGGVSPRERLTATLAGTSLDSGTISLVGALVQISATLAGTSQDSAGASLKESLAATLAGTSLDSGAISLVGSLIQIAATLEGTSVDGGGVSLKESLAATLAGVSFDSATASRLERLAATLEGTSQDSGLITETGGGSIGPIPNTFTTYKARGNREDLGGPRHNEGHISQRAADTIARQIAELLEDR